MKRKPRAPKFIPAWMAVDDPDPIGTAQRIVALDQAREALLASQTYWREKAEEKRKSRYLESWDEQQLWEYQAQSYCFAAAAERLKGNMEMYAHRLDDEIYFFLGSLRRFSDFRPNADDVAKALEAAGGDRAVAARHLRIAALGTWGRTSLEVSADVCAPPESPQDLGPAETPPRLARARFRRLRGLVQLWMPNKGRWWLLFIKFRPRKNSDLIETATRWITILGQAREALLNVAGTDTNQARALALAETMMLLAYHISADLATAH